MVYCSQWKEEFSKLKTPTYPTNPILSNSQNVRRYSLKGNHVIRSCLISERVIQRVCVLIDCIETLNYSSSYFLWIVLQPWPGSDLRSWQHFPHYANVRSLVSPPLYTPPPPHRIRVTLVCADLDTVAEHFVRSPTIIFPKRWKLRISRKFVGNNIFPTNLLLANYQ